MRYERFGIDSDHDYDPVWQKCRELGMAPTFHAGGRGFGLRNSPSNFTYNHIGHFAAAGHAIAKGLFLGGVTRRFPDLNFAFLEGGVGWGCQLFADLIEHWERRGAKGIAYMDPEEARPRSCCAAWSTSTATPTSPPSSTSATAGRRARRTSRPAA